MTENDSIQKIYYYLTTRYFNMFSGRSKQAKFKTKPSVEDLNVNQAIHKNLYRKFGNFFAEHSSQDIYILKTGD